jgi:hypothetical protein
MMRFYLFPCPRKGTIQLVLEEGSPSLPLFRLEMHLGPTAATELKVGLTAALAALAAPTELPPEAFNFRAKLIADARRQLGTCEIWGVRLAAPANPIPIPNPMKGTIPS